MTPEQINSKMAALDTWPGALAREIRSLIKLQFPELTEGYKWNCIMWQNDGKLVLGLAPLAKSLKLCFFNLPDVDASLSKQRWSTTIASQNLTLQTHESFREEKFLLMLRSGVKPSELP